MIKRIMRPVARAGINLIAISTSLIPMLAKGAGKKVLRSSERNAPSPSPLRRRQKSIPSLKASEAARKKYQLRSLLNKNKNYY